MTYYHVEFQAAIGSAVTLKLPVAGAPRHQAVDYPLTNEVLWFY